jgi:hypothetical protein
MDGTEQRPLTDSQLVRELEVALGIEPSPEFLARVRSRVAAEPGPPRWRLSFEPMWGVALVGIVLAVIVPQVMRMHGGGQGGTKQMARIAEPVAHSERKTEAVIVPQMVETSEIRRRLRTENPVESIQTVPLQLSPVLISADERSAFEFFVAAVNQGRVPENAIEPVATEAGEMPALSIEPLAIEALPSLARITAEGESRWE